MTRDHLFKIGKKNRAGWVHKYFEGISVLIMPDKLKGVVVSETAKSCYIQIGIESKPRLKRKHNFEEDLDSQRSLEKFKT